MVRVSFHFGRDFWDVEFFVGSPWGAGTFAGPDGSRQPSPLELEVATIEGKQFWEYVSKVKF